MAHLAVIRGIAGEERYLASFGEHRERAKARTFRCEASAEKAAKEHIAAFPPVIQRAMTFRVEPK